MKKNWFRWSLVIWVLLVLGTGNPANAEGGQTVQLLYATFDPILDGEPAIAPNLLASPNSPYALLQLVGPMQASWSADFQALGVVFYGYLPEFTYLVHTQNQTAVASHPAVRWIGPYHPAYKISPTLSGSRLLLQLFPDANMNDAAANIALTGAIIREENAGANLLIVEAGAALIPALAQIESVMWLQNVVQMQEFNDDARWVSQGNVPYTTPLYEHGLTGAGQVGGVGDSGLSVYDFGGGTIPSCFFLDDGNGGAGGAAASPNLNHRKVIAYTNPPGAIGDNVDGSGHGSHVVGSIVGDQPPWNTLSPSDGQAYEARIYFQDIGIGAPVGLINPPSDYRVLFGQAYDPNGDGLYQPESEPRTHSNSWGSTEATYSVEAMQTDEFMWTHPDFLIFFAAGNQGPAPSTIGQPATAKSIVTVGGTENGLADPNSMGYFSGHGPAPFGRMTPTISAPGDRITSALANDPCGTTEKTGTSMATPIVHGLTLLMRQYLWDGYYPTGMANPADQIHPSAALLKALLINSGQAMSGTHTDNTTGGSWPSNGQGWGRVMADNVLYFQGDHRALWLHDEYALDGSAGFATSGETATFTFVVGDGAPFNNEPLAITLAWSDYPGLPPAGGPLVNNLDLTVIGPDGVVHRGNDANSNDFMGQPDLPPVSPDVINPWEVVYLADPQPGIYTVTVTAANIASTVLDPTRKQGFALVVTGDLLGNTRAEIEYPRYDAAAVEPIRVRVSDAAANSNPSQVETITALVSTSTNPSGVPVTLTETSPNSGIFAGQVTATGPLVVQPGDTVQLTYQNATDTARIEARPLNFINPPSLNQPDNGDGDNHFTLTWQPAENTANLIGYTIQQATTYFLALADNGEGAITNNWTTGQALAEWSSNNLYQHSGSNSFWSGRGDTMVLINSALTLNHEVILPASLSSAQLSFYSRYFNDMNDYGHVEISADGRAWTRLRRLYADPRVAPPDNRFQYHQFDLSDYIGSAIRIRFRYDNGVVSFAPDSPGWWLDDITISGGAWQTIATVGADVASYEVTAAATGDYFYRVRGLYANGSVTGWSNMTGATVTTITQPPGTAGSQTTGGGWLLANNGKKLNFGFSVEETSEGLTGELQLNDKATNVKIHLSELTALTNISGPCDSLAAAPNALEFQGQGTFNGGSASFRVCVQDNDEPGQGHDLFYLTCLTGCNYNTRSQTADSVIDGGNIQVRNAAATGSGGTGGTGNSSTAATLILDPLLLTGGVPGQVQLFTVTAFGADQNVLPNALIHLTRTTTGGQTQSWTLLTDATGTALFSLINLTQTAEYAAAAGGVTSNAVSLKPLWP